MWDGQTRPTSRKNKKMLRVVTSKRGTVPTTSVAEPPMTIIFGIGLLFAITFLMPQDARVGQAQVRLVLLACVILIGMLVYPGQTCVGMVIAFVVFLTAKAIMHNEDDWLGQAHAVSMAVAFVCVLFLGYLASVILEWYDRKDKIHDEPPIPPRRSDRIAGKKMPREPWR